LRERINLSEFESEVYVVFVKRFGDNGRMDLRINFVKVCVEFEWCN